MGRGDYDPIKVNFRTLIWNTGKDFSLPQTTGCMNMKPGTTRAIFFQVLSQPEGQGNIQTRALPRELQRNRGGATGSSQSKTCLGTSLVFQWLRLRDPNAGGLGLVPGQGTRSCMLQLKIPHAAACCNEDPVCCN